MKKGLECCIVHEPDYQRLCPECPYRDPETSCLNILMTDALKIIETLDDALEAVTSDVECETCKINTKGENTHETD